MQPPKFVWSLAGTHELVVCIALQYARRGGRALELGAGSGALTERLQSVGFQVAAVDVANHFQLNSEFHQLDLNDPSFDRVLSPAFDLITSVEVIEHLESPSAFLRSIERLLKPDGIAIITTPNIENIPGRLKFFMSGGVRTMEKTNPEHITPIHFDLFVRQVVPRSGLTLVESRVHPSGSFPLTARRYFIPLFWVILPFVKGDTLTGDCHVFVLKKDMREVSHKP